MGVSADVGEARLQTSKQATRKIQIKRCCLNYNFFKPKLSSNVYILDDAFLKVMKYAVMEKLISKCFSFTFFLNLIS